MAKVIEGYSGIRKDYNRHMDHVKISFLAAVICMLLVDWKGFFFFISVACIVYGLMKNAKANEYSSGVKGERVVSRLCKSLPNTYTVVTNVELHNEGRVFHYDAVIVGPAGVFVMEVKNMNGTITGTESSYEWMQAKVGRNGGRYSNRVRNPIKQLDGQIYQLSNLFRHHQLSMWIKGFVFFTNPQAKVKIVNTSTPVFSMSGKGPKQLKRMLREIEANQQHVSQQAQEKAIAVLTGNVA